MRTLLFDAETTGFKEPQLIEAAWIEMGDDLCPLQDGAVSHRFKPSKAIEFGAMATHHIVESDLANCPDHTSFKIQDSTEYLIGHNIDYDWAVVGKPSVKRICTLALSRYCWPELDSHGLSAMAYFLKGPQLRDKIKNAHSAAVDCELNLIVLLAIIEKLKINNVDKLYEKSELARIPLFITFGKYKGSPISAIPADYALWYRRQPDTDPYLVEAFKRAGLLR